MGVLDKLLTANQGDELVAEIRRMATAFERIAAVAESLTAVPLGYTPPEKLGPDAIREYGQEVSQEDIEDTRAKLQEQGLSDRQIEDQLVRAMFSTPEEE